MKCSHLIRGYCYVKRQELKYIEICPCEAHTEHLNCFGCKYTKTINYCLKSPVCKRFYIAPDDVREYPDKWEG